MDTIGFIGAGNMAEALIKGIIKANICKPKNILINDISSARLEYMTRQYRVQAVANVAALAAQIDVLILSVKPQNMANVLFAIESAVRHNTLVISIAAGIRIAELEIALGDKPIIRVMPNYPAVISEGASALFANVRARPMMDGAIRIFSSVGRIVIIDNEELMDVVTAVSGSGPAYFLLMMEEMIRIAYEMGMPWELAKILVLQTAKGAALLAAERDKYNESPSELRRKVTSPGGTTEAALKVFTAKNFPELLTEALTAARDRSKELSG